MTFPLHSQSTHSASYQLIRLMMLMNVPPSVKYFKMSTLNEPKPDLYVFLHLVFIVFANSCKLFYM